MRWHDLLGAVLIDYFAGSAFVVETEVDLSLKKLFLNLVVFRKRSGDFDRPLPDGVGPLANQNLISFKSHQDTFDTWTLQALVGYYVCYRKQESGDKKKLLPPTEFRLIAISARFPEGLAKEIPLVKRQSGVYDIEGGPLSIRLIVIRELPIADANTILLLFSQATNQLAFACQHFEGQPTTRAGLSIRLIQLYKKEDEKMAVTLADLNRIAQQRFLDEMTLEQRLEGVPTKELLKRVPTEEVLKSIPRRELAKELLHDALQREPKRAEVDAYLKSAKKV